MVVARGLLLVAAMTTPRQVLPQKIVMITRRCLERRFFLKGSPIVNQTFAYLMAIGCKRYDIAPIAAVTMSDHYHLVGVDRRGQHPRLTEWMNAQTARAVNSIRRRTDRFWESGAPVVTELADPQTVLDKCAYTLANPTNAGLVEHGWQWTGYRSGPDAVVRRIRIKRPAIPYFKNSRKFPAEVELRFEVPPTHAHLSDAEFVALLTARTEAMEAEARLAVKASGREFTGPDRLRGTDWNERAKSPEGHGRGRVLKPLVAACTKVVRKAVLERIAIFRLRYYEALDAFIAGARDVVFPAGTYHLVVHHGLACHPP